MSGVQSVERAFAVLRCLSDGPAGVTDVADRVSLPKSTVSRMLSTLEDLGMVEQVEPGGSYRVGSGMIEIAAAVLPGRSLIDADKYLSQPLERSASGTVTDAAAMRARFAEIAAKGYAWAFEEFLDGLNS